MAKPVTRLELIEMMKAGNLQLIDVLPELEFSESHLPGAVNIPLKILDAESVSGLQPGAPTAVY